MSVDSVAFATVGEGEGLEVENDVAEGFGLFAWLFIVPPLNNINNEAIMFVTHSKNIYIKIFEYFSI